MPDWQSSEPGFKSPFATVSKIGHFRSLQWRPCWLSCINEYLAIDSGGNVSDLVVARNCLARMLPGEAELVSEWTGLPGRAKKCTALWADWILRYIETTFKNNLYSSTMKDVPHKRIADHTARGCIWYGQRTLSCGSHETRDDLDNAVKACQCDPYVDPPSYLLGGRWFSRQNLVGGSVVLGCHSDSERSQSLFVLEREIDGRMRHEEGDDHVMLVLYGDVKRCLTLDVLYNTDIH